MALERLFNGLSGDESRYENLGCYNFSLWDHSSLNETNYANALGEKAKIFQ